MQTGVEYENAVQRGYEQCLAAYDDGEPVSINPYVWRNPKYIGWAKAQVVLAERERFQEIKQYRSA